MAVRFLLFIGILAVTTHSALGASLTDRPPPLSLQKDVRCMVETLKAMPKIDSVKFEVARYGGMPNAFVQYRDRSKVGQGETIRFEARALEPPFTFHTMLGGLYNGNAPPSDFGTGAITKAWKARCKIDADVLFV